MGPGAAIGGAAALALLYAISQSRSAAPSGSGSTSSGGYPAGKVPSAYAAGKLSMLRGRYTGELGAALREFAPRLWPFVPLTALVGGTAMSTGRTEIVRGPFTARGYFNTPDATWTRLRALDRTTQLLGREAVNTADATSSSAVDDQVVIGLLDWLEGLAAYRSLATQRGLPYPRSSSSSLAVAAAFLAWSAGPGGAARDLDAVDAQAVASSGDAAAWDAIVAHAVARARLPSTSLAGGGTHNNAWYGLLRTTQKLASGAALARSVAPDELEYFPRVARGELAALEVALTKAAYGVRPQ